MADSDTMRQWAAAWEALPEGQRKTLSERTVRVADIVERADREASGGGAVTVEYWLRPGEWQAFWLEEVHRLLGRPNSARASVETFREPESMSFETPAGRVMVRPSRSELAVQVKRCRRGHTYAVAEEEGPPRVECPDCLPQLTRLVAPGPSVGSLSCRTEQFERTSVSRGADPIPAWRRVAPATVTDR